MNICLLCATFVFIALHAAYAQPERDQPGAGGPVSKRDIEGRRLAEEVFAASGGSAWNDPSWDISFDFVIRNSGTEAARYSHIWYRALDGYIVFGKNREGRNWRVRFSSLARREGYATVDGAEVADTVRRRLVDAAYGRYINDTYWLMMPLKLLDSGVYHRRENDTTIEGRSYQVLALTFAEVGLTPRDRYWLMIDPVTKLVHRWKYTLQSGREGEFVWDEYTQFGPLKLPLRRRTLDSAMEIRFENVRIDFPGAEAGG